MKLLVFTIATMCVLIAAVNSEQPIVKVPELGQVRGSQMASETGRKFYAFRGIPYAQPPIGQRRFKAPLPAEPWPESVLDATSERPACIQFMAEASLLSRQGIEDCLVLNIYTPNTNPDGATYPVMVFIHGGGFTLGSGNGEADLYGPNRFLNRDVVLVTINYRLGPLGFLSTEDVEAPGNYGLLDQSLALRWVRDHIGHFGGDRESVTIFGESAGAASVELQILSPHSKGLFHRAVTQSGSSLCPWAVQKTVGKFTKMLAEGLNCSTSSSRELLDCLRKKDAVDIVQCRQHFAPDFGARLFPIAFGPRVDAESQTPFLPADPYSLITQKKFNAVPYITGVNKNEGAMFVATLATKDGKIKEFINLDPLEAISHLLCIDQWSNGKEIAKQAYDHYLVRDKSLTKQMPQLEQMMSDFIFFKCAAESSRLFTEYSSERNYFYHYTHRGAFTVTQTLGVKLETDLGVSHVDELLLMFNSKLLPPLSTPEDKKVSELLIDLWTSFAIEGIPKSNQLQDEWLPMEREAARYLEINAENPILINEKLPFQPRMAFWDDAIKDKSANRIEL